MRQLPPLYSWAEGGAHGRKGPSASLLFSLWWRQVLVWVLARTYLLARLCLYICIMRWRKTSNVSSFCSGPSAPRPSPSERVPLQNRGDSQNQGPGQPGCTEHGAAIQGGNNSLRTLPTSSREHGLELETFFHVAHAGLELLTSLPLSPGITGEL